MNSCNYLYTISFTVGAEAGIALVAAPNERMAMDLLRNSGNHSHAEPGYSLVEMRNLGLTGACTYGLLMESYVNAREAYAAIVSAANALVGPKGEPGPAGVTDVEARYAGPADSPHVNASLEGTKLVLDFSGLKGDQGEQGEPGDPGPQGEQGPKGDTGKMIIAASATARQDSTKDPLTIIPTVIEGNRGNTLLLDFYNFKGDPGSAGERGPAGIEEANVSVDGLSGSPRVVADVSNGVLSLSFYGLKGQKGDPGTNHSRQQVVSSLPTASAETVDIVYLIQIGNTDEYERYITQYNGSTYSWLQIGTTELDLSGYINEENIVFCTEEEIDAIEIFDPDKYYVTYEDEEDTSGEGESE